MRLLFRKRKQSELLKKEKEKFNLTWPKFAEYLGIKYGRLMAYLMEEALIDDLTFSKLSLKRDYKQYILKKLFDNWGQSKGGHNSSGNTKDILIPGKNEELAELWGIMLGDGYLQKKQAYKIGVYGIKVAGHAIDDKEYLDNYVASLIKKLFNVKVRFHTGKNSNSYYAIADSRKIVDFFEKEGFKAGNKIVNQVTIPKWIMEDNKSLAACLRGLYDTDGSFYRLTNQNSYQVHFKNHNFTLLQDLRKGLIKLGIIPSKIICNKSIVITKRSEIEKFYKVIGFSNPKHLNKIKKLF